MVLKLTYERLIDFELIILKITLRISKTERKLKKHREIASLFTETVLR